MALDRVRKAPIKSGADCAVVPAKLGYDGLLALLNDKEAGGKPNQNCNDCRYAKKAPYLFEIEVKAASTPRWRIAAATVLTQEFTELSIEVTPQFI
jgi:hypothetical protein